MEELNQFLLTFIFTVSVMVAIAAGLLKLRDIVRRFFASRAERKQRP